MMSVGVGQHAGSNRELAVVGTLGYQRVVVTKMGYLLVEGEHMRCSWVLDVQLDYLMVGDVRMGYRLVGTFLYLVCHRPPHHSNK